MTPMSRLSPLEFRRAHVPGAPLTAAGGGVMGDTIERDGAPRAGASFRLLCSVAVLLTATGCASAPMDQAGTLVSYDRLTPSDGLLAHSRLWVSKNEILAAKSVRIAPTVFAATSGEAAWSQKQRSLVANAVDRSLCLGLSNRFEVVPLTETADLTVHAVITHAAATNQAMAGVSRVVALAPTVFLPGVPAPVPRIPIGLGSLSLEAEARDASGAQKAAIVWARGADSFTNAPRVASEGDAYELAASFGADFSKLLVTGVSPFWKLPSLPSTQSVGVFFGGAPKSVACEAFGRDPGVVGFIAERVGAPPDWTDKGAAPAQPAISSSN
ncbi:DUF3313 domain-containing protein [Methylocapsa sp. S129]|uniref:DUF3313 domain-containing protein n=1 Tax=Methylocapsa sp. S129 TaxID=1641869 RepID=UPI001FEEB0E4|nr:DUF3313 domain-containing protein [Methylocapsa sp. S129]